jgi:hypothetical protein
LLVLALHVASLRWLETEARGRTLLGPPSLKLKLIAMSWAAGSADGYFAFSVDEVPREEIKLVMVGLQYARKRPNSGPN